ncbi:MAG: MarR family winged helix-turn-helix transcriptional regulator [Polyangiaceae bacterium]
MHCLPFTLKRAHFASLGLLRSFTLPEQLTPARFDLLYALHRTGYKSPYQWWIARMLGVSRATVCKMIRGLRNLGMLELHVDKKNVHARRISLTKLGRKRFARALKAVRRGRVDAGVRGAWKAAELPRRETRFLVYQLVGLTQRYSRGLDEFTELYRYPELAMRWRANASPPSPRFHSASPTTTQESC